MGKSEELAAWGEWHCYVTVMSVVQDFEVLV
jgi:hypothetical protein